ncbi:putative membrane protein [Desulfosporosinus orientis DSM 765]|uniref:Putative membrane protein n=1 Tax=Desulfosporosinus orientis (strain ATCC 19365 / DSM 765 / NCIMB 8382 / VKM B-1628 / Singapore I) TaxID=768706 RepID=G7WIJ9_DESOD|nr:DUF2238 domain-containing protein [Desulfosporosinus orientis]AET69073.1 putative membrane protein [Desulfosporosinus orientis DSM 765]
MNKRPEFHKIEPLHLGLLLAFFLVLVWSLINPKDLFTWFLEVLPALIGLIVIVMTFHRFRLTNLVYGLVLIHAVILMIGGHYTYAEMPLFTWLKDTLHLERNYYDRLGHFAQGFIPAVIVREILLRKLELPRGKWLSAIVISVCLAISALYELIEWGVAELTGTAAEAFLGTQGDVWDTQWDMFMALWGAILSLIFLSNIHDKFMRNQEMIRKEEDQP